MQRKAWWEEKRPVIMVAGISLIISGLSLPLAFIFSGSAPANTDGIALKGSVDMVLYDGAGKVKDERHIDNLIVNAGIEAIASRIAPHDGAINPSTPFNYIALGTGSTAVSAGQTALAAELTAGAGYGRVQDAAAQYVTASGNKLIMSVTFPPGQGTGTLRESGVFNAATGGDMLARQTFAEIQKAASDTLTITWTITLSTT